MKLKLLIVLQFILFLTQNTFANHENGGEIRYRQLDSLKFEITLTKYRECRGTPVVATDIEIYNEVFKVIIRPTKVNAYLVKSPSCKVTCNPNTISGPYYEANIFRDTVDFNSGVYQLFGTKNYPNVYFGQYGCCRSGFQPYANSGFYIDVMLNLFYIKTNNERIEFNDFENPPEFNFYCNQSVNYSFRIKPNSYNDTFKYKLVKAKLDNKTSYNYDPYKPFYYFCDNVNSQKCNANTRVNPVRGFTFNTSNGNFLATPIKCDELGVMVCQVEVYRKTGDSILLIGYIKREIEFVITNDKNNNIPYVAKNRDYTIKAREKNCIDIPVLDDSTSTQTQADTVEIEILKYPKYGTTQIVDSLHNIKIIRYCWTPNDSDYLLPKSSELVFRAREKSCTQYKSYSIANTTTFTAIAPDSFTQITVKTYEDKNRNGKKDINEPYKSAPFFMQNSSYKILQTDSNGYYNLQLIYSKLNFGIPEKLEYIPSSKDTFIHSKFDSSYTIELGFNYRQGVKGRVYEDYNKNCIFDKLDKPIAGFEIQVKDQNRKVLTDANGNYFIHAAAGNYTIEPLQKKEYTTTCINSYSVNIATDSVKIGYDFAVQKNTTFKDLSVLLKPAVHIRNNFFTNNEILVQNFGIKTENNVQVKMITSVPLTGLFSNKTIYKIEDTLIWVLDSIPKGASKTINFSHTLYKDSFSNGDKLCYKLFLDTDSLLSNNYFSTCETIYDTVPTKQQFKTSKNLEYISETYPELNYELAFQDSFNTRTRILILDTLNASIFDINSFRITDNPNNYSVNLLDHVIFAELSGNIIPLKSYAFSYSIRLKDAVSSEFDIVNKAYRTADNTKKFIMAEVSNRARSFIGLNILDTIVCRGNSIQIAVNTQDKPQNGNRFKVYLSDSTGDFISKTLILDTAVKTSSSLLTCKLPLAVTTGKTYKISISSSKPETNSFISESKQTIEILPLPIPVLNSNLKDGKLCTKDTLRLGATGGILYQFYYSNFPTTVFSAKSTLNFIPQNNSSVAVAVQDANGCINKTENLNISLVPLPNITLSATPNALCIGESVILRSTGSINTKLYIDTTFWKQINSNEDISSNPLFKTSTFKVIGDDSFGCRNEASTQVTVHPLPAKPGIYQTQNALYSAFNTGNQWYSETGKIDSATNKYFYPPINGVYRLEYTDNNGCSAISDPYSFIYYSIHSNTFENGILFYPNPSNGIVSYESNFQSTLTIEIYSADGKKVYTSTIDNASGTIDLQHLPSGTYTVKTISDGVENRQILLIVR